MSELSTVNAVLALRDLFLAPKQSPDASYSDLEGWVQSQPGEDFRALAHGVGEVARNVNAAPDLVLDAEVGPLLGTLGTDIDIPKVAGNVKYIFDTISGQQSQAIPTIGQPQGDFLFALAAAIATTSILKTVSASQESHEDLIASQLAERFPPAAPAIPLFVYSEEPFLPGTYTYDVERAITLCTQFDDHNIDGIRHKSYVGTEDSNTSFADTSRSLAAFVWSINRTIDEHRDDTFVYDFSKLGTEHIARIARSWGIKNIEQLNNTVEAIMKGIGSIYLSDEKSYEFPIPNLDSEEYPKFRYVFNVALASVASAHVALFATGFDSTQAGVFGEVRRTIKEVQDSRASNT